MPTLRLARYFLALLLRVEVVTGAAFAAAVVQVRRPALWELATDLVFISALIAIAFIDFENFVIPDSLVWVAGAAGSREGRGADAPA